MIHPGIYIILASIIWGIDGFVRQNLNISVYMLLFLECGIAGVLSFIYIFFVRRHTIKKIHNVGCMFLHIFVATLAGSWFFLQSLKATESLGIVFVLIGLQPIFTILTSALFLKEHPRASFYAFAATTIFASILLTIGDTGFQIDPAYGLSYIYALLTGICWGSSTVMSKILITKNDAAFLQSVRFMIASVISLVILWFIGDIPTFISLGTFMSDYSISLLFIIFGSDILASVMYFGGLKKMSASITSIFELAFPLTGFVIDFLIHDIVPSPIKIVAALTIIVSIIILPYCHFLEEKKEEKILSIA